MAGSHTLQIVHGLFDNLKVVMDGKISYSGGYQTTDKTRMSRRQGINDCHTTSSRYVQPYGTPGSPKLMADISFHSRDGGWIKQIAESVPMFILITVVEAEHDSQGTSSKCMPEVGCSPQIPQSITILPAETTSRELRHGSLKATVIKNGQRQGHSFGFMVNVRVSPAFFLARADCPWRMISQRGQAKVYCGKCFPKWFVQPIQKFRTAPALFNKSSSFGIRD